MNETIINENYKRNRIFRRLKILGIIVVILVIIAVIFMLVCRVREVVVDGNERYTDREIMEAMDLDDGYQNTLIYYLNHKDIHAIPSLSYVDSVSVKMKGVSTIYIDVVEKVLVGCINDAGMYMYFDEHGVILESSTIRREDIPLISGIEFKMLTVNEKISTEDEHVYEDLLQLTLLLRKYDISIEEVVFDEENNMTMLMGDIKVALGQGKNLEDKISNLKDLLPELEGRKGTLLMQDYDSTKDSTIFRQDEDPGQD